MDIELSTTALAWIPIIMVLVSVSKTWVDSKWSPLVALGISLIASFFLVPGGEVTENITEGILMALTASGLYSGGKTTGKALTE